MVKNKGLVDTSLRGKHGRTALHIAGLFGCKHSSAFWFLIMCVCDLTAILDRAECAKILVSVSLFPDWSVHGVMWTWCPDLEIFLSFSPSGELQLRELKCCPRTACDNGYVSCPREGHENVCCMCGSNNLPNSPATILSTRLLGMLQQMHCESFWNLVRHCIVSADFHHQACSILSSIPHPDPTGESMGCTKRSFMWVKSCRKLAKNRMLLFETDVIFFDVRSMLDSDGNVPLHSAVHAGDMQAVKLCLDNGALISTQQHDLSTPAHLACAQGAIEIVRLMFDSQPHEQHKCMAIKDAQNMTPLVSSANLLVWSSNQPLVSLVA